MTAQQIHKLLPDLPTPDPGKTMKVPVVTTPLVREQHFGEAEGHGWISAVPRSSNPSDPPKSGRTGLVDPKTREKMYPVQYGRTAKFPAGECLEDVARRTGDAFDTLILPIVKNSEGRQCGDVHVLIVAHGIAISEMIGAIFSRCVGGDKMNPDTWRGLKNTAWTRLLIGMKVWTTVLLLEDKVLTHSPLS